MLFTVVPVLGAFYLGLLRWDLLTEPRFVGLNNFQRIATDGKFWTALRNTAYFSSRAASRSPSPAGLGAGAAHEPSCAGIGVFRGAVLHSLRHSWVAVALVWTWIFDRDYGLVNLACASSA